MKTIVGALGTTLISLWEKAPGYVRLTITVAGGIFILSETNIDWQHALQAARIFAGQGAEGGAKSADISQPRRDLRAGLPIPGATALLATQVDQGEAGADQSRATADNTYATVPQTAATSTAATESIEQIEDKVRRHQFVTSTEMLRLTEYQTKIAERDRAISDAIAARANAAAAPSDAQARIAANRYVTDSAIPYASSITGPNSVPDLSSLLGYGRQITRR